MKNKGFSLIEILISMAIFGILLTALTAFFISQNRQYVVQSQIVEMQDNARFAMDSIVRILRNAETVSSPPYGTDCNDHETDCNDHEIAIIDMWSGNYEFKLENEIFKFKDTDKSPKWQELSQNIVCFKVEWDSDNNKFNLKIKAQTDRVLPSTGIKGKFDLESKVTPRNEITFN